MGINSATNSESNHKMDDKLHEAPTMQALNYPPQGVGMLLPVRLGVGKEQPYESINNHSLGKGKHGTKRPCEMVDILYCIFTILKRK